MVAERFIRYWLLLGLYGSVHYLQKDAARAFYFKQPLAGDAHNAKQSHLGKPYISAWYPRAIHIYQQKRKPMVVYGIQAKDKLVKFLETADAALSLEDIVDEKKKNVKVKEKRALRPNKRPKALSEYPFSSGEEMIVKIAGISPTGEGIAYVPLDACNPNSKYYDPYLSKEMRNKRWIILIPFTLLNEIVKVKILQNFHAHSVAEVLEILQYPCKHRVEPKCPYFGLCGGCQYQHIAYDEQRNIKKTHVEEAYCSILYKYNLTVPDLLHINSSYGYRSTLSPNYSWSKEGKLNAVGFSTMGSRKIIDIKECSIASPELNRKLKELRKDFYSQEFENSQRFSVPKRGKVLLHSNETIKASETSKMLDNTNLAFTLEDYFSNSYILPKLLDFIAAEITKPLKDGNVPLHLLDGRIGNGLYLLLALKMMKTTIGVDTSSERISCAAANMHQFNITNCLIFKGPSDFVFELASKNLIEGKKTVLFIGPAQSNSQNLFVTKLLRFKPSRILSLSYNYAAQANFVASLLHNGYGIDSIQPFDSSPQTVSIGNVVTLNAR